MRLSKTMSALSATVFATAAGLFALSGARQPEVQVAAVPAAVVPSAVPPAVPQVPVAAAPTFNHFAIAQQSAPDLTERQYDIMFYCGEYSKGTNGAGRALDAMDKFETLKEGLILLKLEAKPEQAAEQFCRKSLYDLEMRLYAHATQAIAELAADPGEAKRFAMKLRDITDFYAGTYSAEQLILSAGQVPGQVALMQLQVQAQMSKQLAQDYKQLVETDMDKMVTFEDKIDYMNRKNRLNEDRSFIMRGPDKNLASKAAAYAIGHGAPREPVPGY